MIERIETEPSPGRTGTSAKEPAERARQQIEEAAERAKEKGQGFLRGQKDRVASELHAYSSAARKAASRLEDESDLQLAQYINGAADRLDELSEHVSQRDLGELWDEVESMARRRPEIYYGGMFLAGLAAARFLKASRRKGLRQRFENEAAQRQEIETEPVSASVPAPVAGFPSGGSPEFPESSPPAPGTHPFTERPSHG